MEGFPLRKQKVVSVCNFQPSANETDLHYVSHHTKSQRTKCELYVKIPTNGVNFLMLELYQEIKSSIDIQLPCIKLLFVSLGCGKAAKLSDIPHSFQSDYGFVQQVEFSGHIGSMRLAFELLHSLKKLREVVFIISDHNIKFPFGVSDEFGNVPPLTTVDTLRIVHDQTIADQSIVNIMDKENEWRLDEILKGASKCFPNLQKFDVSIAGNGKNYEKVCKFINSSNNLKEKYTVEITEEKVRTKPKVQQQRRSGGRQSQKALPAPPASTLEISTSSLPFGYLPYGTSRCQSTSMISGNAFNSISAPVQPCTLYPVSNKTVPDERNVVDCSLSMAVVKQEIIEEDEQLSVEQFAPSSNHLLLLPSDPRKVFSGQISQPTDNRLLSSSTNESACTNTNLKSIDYRDVDEMRTDSAYSTDTASDPGRIPSSFISASGNRNLPICIESTLQSAYNTSNTLQSQLIRNNAICSRSVVSPTESIPSAPRTPSDNMFSDDNDDQDTRFQRARNPSPPADTRNKSRISDSRYETSRRPSAPLPPSLSKLPPTNQSSSIVPYSGNSTEDGEVNSDVSRNEGRGRRTAPRNYSRSQSPSREHFTSRSSSPSSKRYPSKKGHYRSSRRHFSRSPSPTSRKQYSKSPSPSSRRHYSKSPSSRRHYSRSHSPSSRRRYSRSRSRTRSHSRDRNSSRSYRRRSRTPEDRYYSRHSRSRSRSPSTSSYANRGNYRGNNYIHNYKRGQYNNRGTYSGRVYRGRGMRIRGRGNRGIRSRGRGRSYGYTPSSPMGNGEQKHYHQQDWSQQDDDDWETDFTNKQQDRPSNSEEAFK